MLRLLTIILTSFLLFSSSYAQHSDSNTVVLPGPTKNITIQDRINTLQEIQANESDSVKVNEIQYTISTQYLHCGRYRNAFQEAQKVQGEFKDKALVVQAKCVAATANNCGVSTFELKCNYLYAALLMEQAGLDGSKYEALGPSFDSQPCGGGQEVHEITLECWGITINLINREIISEGNN